MCEPVFGQNRSANKLERTIGLYERQMYCSLYSITYDVTHLNKQSIFLRNKFGNHVIKRAPYYVNWSAVSYYLTALDLFFLAALKDK